MSVYRITLTESGQSFEAAEDETILEAAERAGIILAHSCLSGTCRSCMTMVLRGTIEHDPDYADDLSIDVFEIEEGYRLLCSALAHSDADLEK